MFHVFMVNVFMRNYAVYALVLLLHKKLRPKTIYQYNVNVQCLNLNYLVYTFQPITRFNRFDTSKVRVKIPRQAPQRE